MRTIYLFAICYLSINMTSLGQKPVIDSAAYGKWPSIKAEKISNDGRYSLYIVSYGSVGTQSLTVVSNADKWRIDEYNIQNDVNFSYNNRTVYFRTAGDSLAVLQLGTTTIQYFPHIISYQPCPNRAQEWIAYESSIGKKLTVRELSSGKEWVYPDIQWYVFAQDGKSIVLTSADSAQQVETLKWVDLSTGKTRLSWNGHHIVSYVLNDSCTRLAFVGEGIHEISPHSSLYYYRTGMGSVKCMYWGEEAAEEGVSISNAQLEFSKSGEKLLFATNELHQEVGNIKEIEGGVRIWNYKDSIIQSMQKISGYAGRNTRIWEVLDITHDRIVRLNNANEKVEKRKQFENYILVDMIDRDLAHSQKRFALYLLSTKDGTRRTIFDKYFIDSYTISPDESFVIWFDPERLQYYDFEISTGVTRPVGTSIPVPLYNVNDVDRNRRDAQYGVFGWSDKGHSVYLHDQFDIWRVDLLGRKEPRNATKGYGRAHNCVLSQIKINGEDEDPVAVPDQMLLSAFDINTKESGLLETDRDFKKGFSDLTLGPYSYCIAKTGTLFFDLRPNVSRPVKAKDKEIFLVRRQNATEFPNLFVTDDFKHFKQISFLSPEKKYNWIRSKLVNWKKLDGTPGQGILYFPEDFDSTKKYPIIFECYEKMSNDLNDYLEPDVCQGRINIPYYVSNQYVIFEPDVIWRAGATGEGILNSVIPAAKYLSKFSWVDSTRIGLQGHSFGGYLANYVATHTPIFAAICAASGISDQITNYSELLEENSPLGNTYELGQLGAYGIGVTPWIKPKVYMDNSAIFKLENEKTPLLLMHGNEDPIVPCTQSVELYLAMRRAGKKVWFLEYEGAGHILFGANALDFTIRMKQFFDHYLKGSLAPLWMTKGVPYVERGDGKDLKLDLSGQQP